MRLAAIFLLLIAVPAVPGWAAGKKAPRGGPAVAAASPLDRVAYAVDGAESSHGSDQGMWRLDAQGPQGPMQVSAAAASDVGGGDRFDPAQNREIGRAYLAQLYRRYGDWPDAVAAYNWGIGNLDAWVRAGRPIDGLGFGVSAYLWRVLRDSGLCGETALDPPRKAAAAPSRCADLAGSVVLAGDVRFWPGGGAPRFHGQLDKALRLALAHLNSR